MWITILQWVLNPKNLFIVLLVLLVVALAAFGFYKHAVTLSQKETIVEQRSTMAVQQANLTAMKAQNDLLLKNQIQIANAQKKMQQWADSSKTITEAINKLSKEKDDGIESKVYSDLFDMFLAADVVLPKTDSVSRTNESLLPKTSKTSSP